MTDQQLIEWVYRKLASDWSTSQLRRLGRRVRQSLAVRAALRDRIFLDQLLCQTLAAPSLSPLQVLAACQAQPLPPSAPSAASAVSGWKAYVPWAMGVLVAAAATTYWVFGPHLSPVTTAPTNVPAATPVPPSAWTIPSASDSGAPVEAPDTEPVAHASQIVKGPMVEDDDSPSDQLPPGFSSRPPAPPPLPTLPQP